VKWYKGAALGAIVGATATTAGYVVAWWMHREEEDGDE